MIDTIVAAGILAGFFIALGLALHYAAKARKLEKRQSQLLVALEKAQRNDTPKDPVTGRFVKKS